MEVRGGRIRRSCPPGINCPLHAFCISAEALRQRLEESDARTNRERGITAENFSGQGDARGLATAGQEIFAKFHEAFGASRCLPPPVARKQRAPTLGDGLKQL